MTGFQPMLNYVDNDESTPHSVHGVNPEWRLMIMFKNVNWKEL